MAPLNLCFYGNPTLDGQCSAVNSIDDELASLARDMIETMYSAVSSREGDDTGAQSEDAPGGRVISLSAPQVGIQKRIFAFDTHDGNGARVIVNPVIHARWGQCVLTETCLSLPGMTASIERASNIHLSGRDLDGNEIDVVEKGPVARVIQHEVDHLDGRLMLDRLDPREAAAARETLRTSGEGATDLVYS